MRLLLLALLVLPSLTCAAQHPLLPVQLKPGQASGLRAGGAPLLALPEADMLKLVPEQSGLFFVSCPNCARGMQETQLTRWDLNNPDVVKCAYCGEEVPSAKYPMDKVQEVKTPSGSVARYPYYEGRPAWWKEQEPYRYYFQARVDYQKIRCTERAAADFARLYWLTRDPAAGRRAALLLARFAQVFPAYCYHFDYPFRQKVIKEGNVTPEGFSPAFRVARWTWWAYMDISTSLLEAYDLIAASGELEKLSAETGRDVPAEVRAMLTSMTEQALGNKDDLTNMSPGMWADVIQAGRVLERPEWVHEAVGRLRAMARSQFFYDGAWMEGTPSYHSQVVGALRAVYAAASGYSDPPGYKHPRTGERFDRLDLEQALPETARVRDALLRLRLPNGRYTPVHDTWWTNGGQALTASRPDLLPGLGHGILGSGEGDSQVQAHLTWSPGYGHIHLDGLSLLLFARGQELLSDLGYTHTKWREYTVLSPSHNLVVVDGVNQKADHMTLGHLRFFTAGPDVQAVSVDNPQVYPGVTEVYRRTVALVRLSPTDSYLVDCFEVQGGKQHDYFLHGSADDAQTLTAPGLTGTPLPTLLPAGVKFSLGTNEQSTDSSPYHAYGYLRDLQSFVPTAGVTPLDYSPVGSGAGLQAFLVTQPGDQLVLGRDPAIRKAGSDDSKLESTWRQFALLRRTGGKSLFAAVLAPYGQTKAIRQVRVVDVPGARLALEVQTDTRTDLIVVGIEQQPGSWQGKPLSAHCDLAVLGVQEGKPQVATVIGGWLMWGDLDLKIEPATMSAALMAVTHGATPSLTVAGEFPAAAGAVVTLDHAGQYTSAYTVKQAVFDGVDTKLLVAEDPGCDWTFPTKTSTWFTAPLQSFRGDHMVKLIGAAHLQRQ